MEQIDIWYENELYKSCTSCVTNYKTGADRIVLMPDNNFAHKFLSTK